MCVYPNIMAVPNSSPDRSVPDFIARAKADPGKVTYASSGVGTSLHLAGELFKHLAGVNLTHIPYRGAGPALNDLLPGRVDAIFSNFPSTLPYVQNGQLRGLAASGKHRSKLFPALPTVGEFYPGYAIDIWLGLFAPAHTPAPVVDKLRTEVHKILARADFAEKLNVSGSLEPLILSPADFSTLIRADYEKYGKIVRDLGIKSD